MNENKPNQTILNNIICLAYLFFILIFSRNIYCQEFPKPKLVVSIVVDQMRYDYLYRYYNKYSEYGFKKLINKGYNFRNTHYNYAPTYTSPGHASIFTGATPAQHGIIGNNWYSRLKNKLIYAVDDSTVNTVGSTKIEVGKMSPINLLATTVTDELRLSNNGNSKVIAVSLKDRGAILPGGHSANAAYWFDSYSGNWITSSYYMEKLPEWLNNFNARKLPQKYLSQEWNTLLPINNYTESAKDDNLYEGLYPGELKPTFPHAISKMWKADDYEIIRFTPFGNTLTMDIALASIEGEKLGQGNFTDFLSISFSSPDYIGHKMGPQSIEIEDTYLRLDLEIGAFLKYLEQKYGPEGFLFFLTADHGAAHVPLHLTDQKIPAGRFSNSEIIKYVETFLNEKYGVEKWVLNFVNQQIYLDHTIIKNKKISLIEIQEKIADHLLQMNGVSFAYTSYHFYNWSPTDKPEVLYKNGYYPKRSGDVTILFEPGWMDSNVGKTGTTHGTSFNYDTHVPLIWYGWHVSKGSTGEHVDITDIAPTVSDMLKISLPNTSTGKILTDYFKK